MVVSTTTSRVEYNGNGSTTAFAYTFRIFADGDLKVYVVSSAGVATLKTITTHYTVSGAGDASGGTVTMGSAPASGETLVIERSVAYTQSTDYVESDSFSAETHEEALDRNTMLTQQNQRDIGRSMRLSKGTADSVSVELPAPVASHFIKWNADADALESAIGTADQVTVTDFMATVLDDTTQAAAQTTLGLGTGDSPQFTGVNVGHASDTTVTRASAGDLNVEGNIVYRAGGTDVPVTDGGTGASSLTDGGVLLGSGTGAITAMAALGDGEMIVGDGSGDPVAESGATLRTSIGLGTGDSPTFTTVTAQTSIIPDAAGGADLGSTSAEWGDVYVADDKAIKLGNDQDFTIEYDEDGLDTTRVVAAGGVTMSPHGTSSGNTTELRFLELAANGNNYAGFKAPDSVTGNSVYQLPPAYPASSKYLQSTDAGVLSWESISLSLTGIDDQSSSNDDQITISDTAVIINEDGDDLDFRIESNGNTNAFDLDGNLHGGVGAVGIGRNAENTVDVLIGAPAITADANQSHYRLRLVPAGAVTIPSGTAAEVATLSVFEPNISATGTVTTAASVWVHGAPTEASSNFALLVDDGASRFDGNVSFGSSQEMDITTSGKARGPNGTVGGPTFSFKGDDDTGIYLVNAGQLGVAAAGSLQLRVQDNSIRMQSNGSETAPSFTWNDNPDTGWFVEGTADVSLAMNGYMEWSFVDERTMRGFAENVAHGLTGIAPTDCWGVYAGNSGTYGGAKVLGLAESGYAVGLSLEGYGTGTDSKIGRASCRERV